jgi:hypothetical protein
MIAFRIVHITSAILWFGAALFYAAFIGPTVAAMGPDGGRFFIHVVRRRRAVIFFLVVSTLTVVAGGFLYWRASGGLDIDWMRTGFGTGLTVGAITGLFSWFLVLTVLAPTSYRLTALAERIASASKPPSQEAAASLQTLQARLRSFSWLNIVSLTVATVAMASARYLTF